MQGPDLLDPRTQCLPFTDPMAQLRRGVRGLRLASMPERERHYASGDVLDAYDGSLAELERLGAQVVPIDLPFALADIALLNLRIMAAESYVLLRDLVDDENAPLDPHVRARILPGRDLSASDYLEALNRRQHMQRTFSTAMDGIDAVLTPTTMTTAVPLEDVDESGSPAHYTRFVNYLDLTAVALPNGFAPDGLPTSLQIVCRGRDEATALRIGWAYQQATEWHLARPPVPASIPSPHAR